MHNIKGQISLDALLAFIALMLLLQFFLSIAANFASLNEENYILAQLKENALLVKDAINACKIAKFSNKNASINIVIPKIDSLGKNIEGCKIEISQNKIFINAKTEERDFNYSLELPEYNGNINLKCGEVLSVEC